MQVSAYENHKAIEKALHSAGNQHGTIMTLHELNHLFQHSQIGLPTEYSIIEETLAPEVLNIMLD